MPLLTGFFKDSGSNPITSGILRIRLDAPMVEFSATVDSLLTQQAAEFAITNGAIPTINIPESATQQITYEFTLFVNTQTVEFYYPNGDRYDGPTILHTDSKWYTGISYRADASQELDRFVRTTPRQIDQFHAIVPNTATVEYSALIPTRVTTDKLPTTIRQIAELLINVQQYRQALRGGPNAVGTFNPNIFYALDDWVEYDGSSYVYINPLTTRGNYPPNTTYWQLVASRGATGTGTSGNNTPYDAATWNGQIDAPSRNALRNIIEQLARTSQLTGLAPLNSPVFTGNPSRSSNPIVTDNSTQLATTQWSRTLFAPIDSPTFTGNPAVPLQATNDRSNRPASTQWVDNYFNSLNLSSQPFFVARKTNAQTLTNGNNTIVFNVELIDTANAFNPTTTVFIVPPGRGGWYEFVAFVYLERSGGATFDALLSLIQGSTTHRLHHLTGSTATNLAVGGNTQLFLNEGESISLSLSINSGGTLTTNNVYTNTVLTQFCGKRLYV